jgi:hypothetical protein
VVHSRLGDRLVNPGLDRRPLGVRPLVDNFHWTFDIGNPRNGSAQRLVMTKEDKYLAVQALEWFDGVRDRVWDWVFDEKQGFRNIAAIMYFIFGALVVHFVPKAPHYVGLAIGALIILLLIASFLIPVALFVEWAFRRVFL